MSDELDPGLRRLFASTGQSPADEAFVAEVAARTSRENAWVTAGRAAFAALVFAVLAMGLRFAVIQGASVVSAFVSVPPLGWAAGMALVLAGVIGVRALAPLAGSARL